MIRGIRISLINFEGGFGHPWGIAPLFLLLLFVGACNPGGPGGREIIRVNNEIIRESEFTDELEYQASFREITVREESEENEIPQMITEEGLKACIVSQMLIPLAAVKAKYKEKIPELMMKAEEIKKKIQVNGDNFKEVATTHSKDKADVGGNLGTISRRGYVYPLPRKAFTAEEGEIVGPFLSLVGCHILFVHGKVKGTVPAVDTVRVSHILLPYEEGRPDFMAAVLPEIVKKAKIEVLVPEYEAYTQME